MTTPWNLERYMPMLRVLARQTRLDPRLRPRFDESDIAGEAMAAAVERIGQFCGTSEGELVLWLKKVFHTTFLDMVRDAFARKRTPELEAALAVVAQESSARLENFLA